MRRLVVLACSIGMSGCLLEPSPYVADRGVVDPPDMHQTFDPYPEDASRVLCDGTSRLRLGAFLPPVFGRGFPASLYDELGSDYLYVDGHCHYWLSNSDPGNQTDGHEGVLDAELAARVAELFHYQAWPAMVASPPTCLHPDPPVADGSWFGFTDGVLSPRRFLCPPEDLPIEFVELYGAVYDLRKILEERAAPVEGPVKAVLQPASSVGDDPVFDWPIATDPAELVAAEFIVIADPADADALRQVKAQALATENVFQVLVRAPDGSVYSLFVRDLLPFESADDPYVSF